MPQIVKTTRGPTLSFNQPIKIPDNPMIREEMEKAPETRALLHSNSAVSGFIKTPKEARGATHYHLNNEDGGNNNITVEKILLHYQ